LVNAEFVVAAADVLNERVSGDDDSGSVIRFQAAHRSQALLQLPVICFHAVVGVELRAVPGTRGQLIKNMWIHRLWVPNWSSMGADAPMDVKLLTARLRVGR
jgi:hypothetical protein